MAFEQRDNSGALFKNERKEKDTHPDYKGNARLGGVDYDIAAWVKEAQGTGKKYFSLSIKPKEEGMARRAGADQGQSQARSAPEAQRRGYAPSPQFADPDTLPF